VLTNRLAFPWDTVKTRLTSTDREALVPPVPGRGALPRFPAAPVPPTEQEATAPAAYQWWVGGVIVLVAVIVSVSFEALTLALPTMMVSMRVGLNEISWTMTAYMISRTLVVGIVAWLGNRLGNRNLFALGLGLFTAGALLCGVAWSFELLVLFRIVQGLGAGPLIPLAILFLHDTFPPQQRGLAQSLYLVGDALGAIVGRTVAGYCIDLLGWRVVFYINVPFGLIALVMLLVLVPNRRETQVQAIDPWGILLLATFVVCLLIGLNHGSRYGWETRSVQTLLVVSGLAGMAFVITECLVPAPLMNLRLYRIRSYSLISILAWCNSLGLMGAFFLAPLMLQRVQGFTPLQTGLLLIPGAIAWGASGFISGKLSDLLDVRIILVSGFAVTIAILGQLATVTADTPAATLMLLFFCLYCSSALLSPPITMVSMRTVPAVSLRMGTSMLNLVRGIGWAVGIALLSLVIDSRLQHHMERLDQNQSVISAELEPALRHLHGQFLQQGDFDAEAGDKALQTLYEQLRLQATVSAYQECFLGLALLYAFAFLPLLGLGRRYAAPPVARPAQD
jgi:DHA2 family multidrug resistance protein